MDPAAAPRPPRKTNAKRVIAAVVAWLVVGAVLNVAASWGLAAWLPQKGWSYQRGAQSDDVESRWGLLVENFSRIGASRTTWDRNHLLRFISRDHPVSGAVVAPELPVSVDIGRFATLPWGRTRAVLALPEAATYKGCDHATGWPVLSLWYGINVYEQRFEIEGGLPLRRRNLRPHTQLWQVRALPFHPIWPGFALNTLFFAPIACVLWRAILGSAQSIRRHRRRTRGLCVKCAYNRAGLAPSSRCPECGHTPTPSLSAASA